MSKTTKQEPTTVDAVLITILGRMNETQERELRWRNLRFFAISVLILLGIVVYAVAGVYFSRLGKEAVEGEYAALLRIDGIIDSEGKNSANKLGPALVKAFRDKEAKGVVLLINSPGGSPVQAALIYDRIRELKKAHPHKKVVAVGQDMVTSAAYFIAAAADEIYINRSTVAGSIGVISAQFGLPGLLQKLGVERRVLTAGTNKNRLDQYLPLKDADVRKMDGLLTEIHRHFISAVEDGRKGKLKPSPTLFSGDFWTGNDAVRLGLVDGLSDLPTVLRTHFKVEATSDYTPLPNIFDRLSKSFALGMRDVLVDQSALTFY